MRDPIYYDDLDDEDLTAPADVVGQCNELVDWIEDTMGRRTLRNNGLAVCPYAQPTVKSGDYSIIIGPDLLSAIAQTKAMDPPAGS